MTTRREVLVAGAAIASSLLAGCSPDDSGGKKGASVDVKKADVPAGGGLVLKEAGVVVTQPEKGQFAAFSGKCTHAGCMVKDVREDGIYCPCHASKFQINDGQPTAGPATEPLGSLTIHDNGDTLTVEL